MHVFPFRMTQANLEANANSPWSGFWANLKEAYDAFERTRTPPQVSVCGNRYVLGQPSDSGHCVTNVSEASVAPVRARIARYARYSRLARRGRAASRVAHRRNARHAYAAARRARVAAHARRHAMSLGGPRRTR